MRYYNPFTNWLSKVTCSSEPSGHSGSSSQRQVLGKHWPAHWRWVALLQAAVSPAPATSGHWSSSEPSWQSFSMSHTQPRLMHWPLSQQNCFSWSHEVLVLVLAHIGGGKGDPGRGGGGEEVDGAGAGVHPQPHLGDVE